MTPPEFYGNQTSATQDADSGTLNVKTLAEAIMKLRALPKNDQWLLIGPDGIAYQGKIESILRVIIKNHPIFEPDFSKKVINRTIVP